MQRANNDSDPDNKKNKNDLPNAKGWSCIENISGSDLSYIAYHISAASQYDKYRIKVDERYMISYSAKIVRGCTSSATSMVRSAFSRPSAKVRKSYSSIPTSTNCRILNYIPPSKISASFPNPSFSPFDSRFFDSL